VEPLKWSDDGDRPREDLEHDLAALAEHLEGWSGDAGALPNRLRASKLTGVDRLPQSFLPAVEVLRLRLTFQETESEGIFLRQRIAPALPSLWPLLDTAANLYAFLDGLPGALDLTRENALDYGIFFANEAIAGEEGPFTVYRDFALLPDEYRDALKRNPAELRSRAQPGDSLFSMAVAHIEAALAGGEPEGFSRVEYNRVFDAYVFVVFVGYGTGLYAATISIDRGSGVPTMGEDEPLVQVPPATRHPRLPPSDLSGAFRCAIPPAREPSEAFPFPLRSITGEEAAGILVGDAALHQAQVEGDVSLSLSAALGSVQIRNCDIKGALRFAGLRLTGDLALENVRVATVVDLRGVHVAGSLRLSSVRLAPGGAPGGSAGQDGVQLGDASVGGVLEVRDCELSGPLVLADAQVNAAVRLTSVRATELNARRLSVGRGPILIGPAAGAGASGSSRDAAPFGTITEANVDLDGASTPSRVSVTGSHVGGACVLSNMRVGGALEIGRDTRQGFFVKQSLDLSGTQVSGDLRLRGSHVGGSVFMAGGRVGGGLRLGSPHGAAGSQDQDGTVGKDLSLASCDVQGPVSLGGVQLRGTLRLELCRLGAVVAEGRLVWERNSGSERGPRPTILPTKIRNRVEISACEIRGELRFSGALVDARYAGRYAVEVASSTVGQGVSFWDEGLAEPRSSESAAGYLAAVADEIKQARGERWGFETFGAGSPETEWPVAFIELPEPGGTPATLTGAHPHPGDEISLHELRANLSARRLYTEIRGDLRMALCRIGGDVCLTNLHAEGCRLVLEGLDIQGDLQAEWNGRRYRAPARAWSQEFARLLNTQASTMEMSGSTIKGETRLTGLRLTGLGRPGALSPATLVRDRAAALAVKYCTLHGALALSEVRSDHTWSDEASLRASLRGDLDVSWSTIDHLILDGSSLGAMRTGRSDDRPNRLVAASATIRNLELRYPLPGEVDLADARVAVWDFGHLEGEELLQRFHNVLENQEPFKRNVYQEVEAYLYNAGFEDLAKAVHMRLVARQHRDTIDRLHLRDRSTVPRRGRLGARLESGWDLLWAWLNRGLSLVNRFATGNFTSEWRPILWCWLPLWAMSSCYFVDPARVEVGPDYRRSFDDNPAAICATLDRWGFLESVKFTTRYVLPVVPSVGMVQLGAADVLQTHPLCLAVADRIRHPRPTVPSRIRGWFDWMRPSTVATWVRVLSWLFLSLATGTIFAKMSRTPRRTG